MSGWTDAPHGSNAGLSAMATVCGVGLLAMMTCVVLFGCGDDPAPPADAVTDVARDADGGTHDLGDDADAADTEESDLSEEDAARVDVDAETPPPDDFPAELGNHCLGVAAASGEIDAEIAWDELSNPILSFEDHAAKDMTLRLIDGAWVMMFSYIADDPFRFRIGRATSDDFAAWSFVEDDVWDEPDAGGLASPELVQLVDGSYAVSFNTHTQDITGAFPKLYYRNGTALGALGPSRPLGAELYERPRLERQIDVAIAVRDEGLVAGFKHWQTFEIAVTDHWHPEGRWTLLGAPEIEGIENYQFVRIDGRWHMIATTLDGHDAALYRLDGNPAVDESWLSWTKVRELEIPQEDWNQVEQNNAAHLCDARAIDGHFYLLYAGSNELDTFRERGHAKIGVARSADLVAWEVP